MKRINHFNILTTLFLTAAMIVLFETSLTAQDTIKKIDTFLRDWKKVHVEQEKIMDPDIASNQPLALRLAYIKPYYSDLAVQDNVTSAMALETAIRRERLDNMTLILIPRSKDFNLTAALKKSIPEPVDNDLRIEYCNQYGLKWAETKGEFADHTLYLGNDDRYYYFGRSNLMYLDALRSFLKLKGGFDRIEVFAETLNIRDGGTDLATPKYLVRELVTIGNPSIPAVEQSARESIRDENPPYYQFLTLHDIATPESQKALMRFQKSKDSHVNKAIELLLATAPMRKEMHDFYLQEAARQRNLQFVSFAVSKFGWEKEAIPVYRKMAEKPQSFEIYTTALLAIANMERPPKDPLMPHPEHVRLIKLLSVRAGDIPTSSKYLEIGKTQSFEKEERLEKEDRARLTPHEMALINHPNKELNVACAIALCLFDAPKDIPGVNPRYIKRVQASGMKILEKLPKADVDKAFRILLRNTRIQEENKKIAGVYSSYRSKN